MAEIVEVDKSGRIVIPKRLRKDLGIKEKTKFILARRGEGQILLQKLDVEKIAQKLETELAGKDIDAITEAVRKEINEKIRKRYPDLLA
ncbi:MAG: AbrB family looped-hinge helix DNA binding protein [Candidatus Nitrosomirales archaeon]|jgi:AbrB family looped-hinge helix DNA binding protein